MKFTQIYNMTVKLEWQINNQLSKQMNKTTNNLLLYYQIWSNKINLNQIISKYNKITIKSDLLTIYYWAQIMRNENRSYKEFSLQLEQEWFTKLACLLDRLGPSKSIPTCLNKPPQQPLDTTLSQLQYTFLYVVY